jgi:hypothetical protein
MLRLVNILLLHQLYNSLYLIANPSPSRLSFILKTSIVPFPLDHRIPP